MAKSRRSWGPNDVATVGRPTGGFLGDSGNPASSPVAIRPYSQAFNIFGGSGDGGGGGSSYGNRMPPMMLSNTQQAFPGIPGDGDRASALGQYLNDARFRAMVPQYGLRFDQLSAQGLNPRLQPGSIAQHNAQMAAASGGGGGGGGGNFGQGLQDALNAANAANEQRYLDMMQGAAGLHGRTVGRVGDQNESLLKGYNDRFSRIMGTVNGIGDQELADINDRYNKLQAGTRQDLVSRGLDSSTVRASEDYTNAEERSQALGRAMERIADRRAQYDSQLSADMLDSLRYGQDRINNADTSLTNNMLGMMERRTDTGPDIGQYLQLAQMAGAGNAGFGGGGANAMQMAGNLQSQLSQLGGGMKNLMGMGGMGGGFGGGFGGMNPFAGRPNMGGMGGNRNMGGDGGGNLNQNVQMIDPPQNGGINPDRLKRLREIEEWKKRDAEERRQWELDRIAMQRYLDPLTTYYANGLPQFIGQAAQGVSQFLGRAPRSVEEAKQALQQMMPDLNAPVDMRNYFNAMGGFGPQPINNPLIQGAGGWGA